MILYITFLLCIIIGVIIKFNISKMDKFDIIIQNQQLLLKKQLELMATIQELNDKVDQLQVALDAEQAEIAAILTKNSEVIAQLEAVVVTLQDTIANSATPEQLQAVSDKIDAAIADLQGTVTPEA